jgi:DNA-binding FadR family transcriptional regulator
MTDELDTLMRQYWDAVDARQPEKAAEIMKQIGQATGHTQQTKTNNRWTKDMRW